MGFEDDVMANAVNIENTAIQVALHQQSKSEDGRYAATSGPELYFQGLAQLFRPYSQLPDPAGYDPMVDHLTRVLYTLSSGLMAQDPIEQETFVANGNLGAVAGSESFMEKWHGKAADAFKDSFIDWFPTIVKNQFIVASTVRAALRAYRNMWEAARRDVLELQSKTLVALDASPRCNNGDWTIVFSVIEAVAVIAAVPTGGGSLGAELAIAGVAATAGVAANWPKEDDPDQHNTSGLAWQVVEDMYAGLRRIFNAIGTTEQKIYRALDHNNSFVDSQQRSFVNPRPDLTRATASDITSQQYLGTAS
jgi:hypothetical protein